MTKELQGSPEYIAAWGRFDAAVADCRRIEARYGLSVWGEYVLGGEIRRLPRLPDEYAQALAEWHFARRQRNHLHQLEVRHAG